MSAISEVSTHSNFISAVFKEPLGLSTKKKWYITFTCEHCKEITEKLYQKNKWNFTCAKCNKGKKTTSEFIQECILKHGIKYCYDNINYINNNTHVIIGCHIHGNWTVRPTDFLRGTGCPKCADTLHSNKQAYSIEDWNTLIKNKHVTLLEKYSLYYGKFLCELHGEYDAEIHRTISTQSCGCQICSLLQHQIASKRPNLLGTKAYIYYGYFKDINMYKLGVTIDLSTRFSGSEFTVIWSEEMLYEDAIEFEHSIHTQFYKERYCGTAPLIASGSYELYYKNIFPTYTELLKRRKDEQ